MNKDEFLAGLKKSLKRLPPEDAADAVEYYEEYLEDAGPKNEAAALGAWGPPERVASQISAEYAMKRMEEQPSAKKGLSTVWVVILAIFASPIAIPVAAVAVCVMLLLVIAVAVAVAAFGTVAVSLAACGVLTFVMGLCLLFVNFQTAVFYIGAGLFLAGAGTALFPPVVWLSKKGFGLVARLFGRILPGRKTR